MRSTAYGANREYPMRKRAARVKHFETPGIDI